jgi:hypothetical protein
VNPSSVANFAVGEVRKIWNDNFNIFPALSVPDKFN